MMTSRSENRLLLREDNADERLTEIGYKVGLISQQRYDATVEKYRLVDREVDRLEHANIGPSEQLNAYLVSRGTEGITNGSTLAKLIRRPQVSYSELAFCDPDRPELPDDVCEQAELRIKYDGYIKIQLEQVEAMRKLEQKLLPEDADYSSIHGLRLEAREKLQKIRPRSIGQASRISGVNPADVSVLLIWLEQEKKK